jgi:hypothetical protein
MLDKCIRLVVIVASIRERRSIRLLGAFVHISSNIACDHLLMPVIPFLSRYVRPFLQKYSTNPRLTRRRGNLGSFSTVKHARKPANGKARMSTSLISRIVRVYTLTCKGVAPLELTSRTDANPLDSNVCTPSRFPFAQKLNINASSGTSWMFARVVSQRESNKNSEKDKDYQLTLKAFNEFCQPVCPIFATCT